MPLYTGDINFGMKKSLDLEEYQPSTLEVLKSEWQTGLAMNPLQSLENLSLTHPAPGGELTDLDSLAAAGYSGIVAESITPMPEPMPLDQQKKLIAESGLADRLEPHKAYTADVLDSIIKAKKEEITRQFIYEKATTGQAVLGFGAGMAAGFVDPINIVSTLVPLPGPMELRLATMLGRAGNAWGRAGVRAAQGALSGVLGAALVEPLVAAGQNEMQADYTALNSLMNVAGGAVLGATLKAGGGALGEWRRNVRNRKAIAKGELPEAQPWEYVPPSAESAALRQRHAADLFAALRDTEAGKKPDELRIHVDDLATAYDAWARHIAYRAQVPVGKVYERWALDYQSGEVFDRRVASARELVENVDNLRSEIEEGQALRDMATQTPELRIPDSGLDLDAARSRLAVLEKGYAKARELVETDNAIRRGLTMEQIKEGQVRLEREAQAWADTVDAIAQSGRLPHNLARMLSQTPLVMRLLDTDPKAGATSAQGGIYVSPHAFDGKHPNIGPSELKQLPKALADPIAIFDSETHKGDLVFMTEIQDAFGSTVVVPIELRARQKKPIKSINRAKSVYAKDFEVTLADNQGMTSFPDDIWFIRQLNKNARYVNGQKLENWMQARGSNSQGRLQAAASNSSGLNIFSNTDLVNLREQNPSLYQLSPSWPNAIGGNETKILGANGLEDKARYEVWELSDLIPSHEPQNRFARRKEYPPEAQERPYHTDSGEQDKVRKNALQYHPDYVINSDPTAANGPPIITRKGIVLGGNSRAMTLDLVYASNPDAAKAYGELLQKHASIFGIDPGRLSGVKQPVLVRVMDGDPDIAQMARKSREYNQTTTQKLQAEAEAISRSRFFSRETLAAIAAGIEENGSLARFLNTNDSITLAHKLVEDGVILESEHSSFTGNTGRLNDQGKRLVQNALRGLIVQDYDTLSLLPARIAEKLDLCVAAVTRMKATGPGWDLSGAITDALRLLNKADINKIDLETWFGQHSMTPDALRDNPVLQTLALTFKNADAREIRVRMEIFASDAEEARAATGNLFGAPAVTPDSAFRRAFLREAASVDGIHFGDFNPAKRKTHAALKWAKDNVSKKGTVEVALEKIQKQLLSGKLPEEQKALLARHRGELARFVGRVEIYPPKLGEHFPADIPAKLVIPPPPKAGEPRAPISLVEKQPAKKDSSPPAGKKTASVPAPEPSLSELAAPLPQVRPRGAVSFIGKKQILVRFFRSADFSTAPHELYHIIQKQLEELATGPDANAEFRQMWQAACKFVGATEGMSWTVAQHEKFARAAERYFLDGVTPNPHIRPIMERMREQFLEVYSDADAAGLEISASMRSVFDSMLALPMEKAEMRFERAIAELNARKWEAEFYDPAQVPDYSHTPYAADLAHDPSPGRAIMELSEQDMELVIQTLEQSANPEEAALGQEFRKELTTANEDLERTMRLNRIIEELAACSRARGF